jgi:hypothetical protein
MKINVVFLIKEKKTNAPKSLFLFLMNQTILFRFAIIINSIILYIYGCVTFQDDSNEQCSELETSDEENKSILQCIIQDPTAKMDSTECDMKKFDVINVSMSNLEEMEIFFLDNNETMVKFLQLFKNESHLTTQLIIELEDILSTSNSVDLAINKQWITKYFGHLTSDNLRIDIYMKANDWSEVNLTIHADVNDIPKSKTIELYLEKSDRHMLCTLYVTPSALYNSTYMKSLCRDYVTFVDHRMSMLYTLILIVICFSRWKCSTLASNRIINSKTNIYYQKHYRSKRRIIKWILGIYSFTNIYYHHYFGFVFLLRNVSI